MRCDTRSPFTVPFAMEHPMRHSAGVLTAALLLAGGCMRTTSTATQGVAVDQPFTLRIGESADARGTPLHLTLASANDSRCPTDVVCVTAGDAYVVLVSRLDGAERTDTLYLAREPRSASRGDHRIELVGLDPYPVSTARDVARVATLRVSGGR
jgi:hypothetical protein